MPTMSAAKSLRSNFLVRVKSWLVSVSIAKAAKMNSVSRKGGLLRVREKCSALKTAVTMPKRIP